MENVKMSTSYSRDCVSYHGSVVSSPEGETRRKDILTELRERVHGRGVTSS